MNLNLNSIIKRKRFDNYLKNGVSNMEYRISEEFSKKAEKIIMEDEINERLVVLNNQLKFLDAFKEVDNVTLSDNEMQDIKLNLNKIEDSVGVLNFKKDNLQVMLDKSLSNINIADSIRLKEELNGVEKDIDKFNVEKLNLESKIKNSQLDYDMQMMKIRDKYNNVDIFKNEIDSSEFSSNVISSYKKEKASNLINQFLESLPEEKQKQILNENEDWKGYVNVGENF